MEKYVLTRKELKGGKYLYTVTDETGQVISTRKSKRDYVACTIYGDFYFGRLDLIGSGEHGARLTRAGVKKMRRSQHKDNATSAHKMAAYFNEVMEKVVNYTNGYPYKQGVEK